ncbi:MAG TPA: lipoyl(octanoyl) transferase LipB [Nitrospiraceae bacterium]|nr:lipoyl(octanoyl) transferase LipB [Nitrospiraceae bacterium]
MTPSPISSPAQRTTVRGTVYFYTRLEYGHAWTLQRALVEERMAERCPDTLLLLEHNAVFTIGRSGREDHWGSDEGRLVQSGYPVYRIERGGSITFHGPGQIVGYPILRLASFCAGPKAYVRMLEEVLIRTLAVWGIAGRRLDPWPGVWVDLDQPAKIAAIGVKIQRGVTMHGFALNATMDLSPFQLVTPCGIQGCRVTSMAEVLGHDIPMDAVRKRIAESFAELFGIEWTEWRTDGQRYGHEEPGTEPIDLDKGVRR